MLQENTPLLWEPAIIAAIVSVFISFLTSIFLRYFDSWRELRQRRKSLRRALGSEIKGADWIDEDDTYNRLKENIQTLEKPFGHSYIPTQLFDEGLATEIGILPEAEDVANYYTQAHIMQDFIKQIQGTDPSNTKQERDLLANRQLRRFRAAYQDAIAAIEEGENKESWNLTAGALFGFSVLILGMTLVYVVPFVCS